MVMVCEEEIVPGAVYKPPLVRVPIDGLMLQVTAELLVPVTVAVNCCRPLTVSVADGGLTDTATGLSVAVAAADLVESATLVAVLVTGGDVGIVSGAVTKRLVVSVPSDGLFLHVTRACRRPMLLVRA